MSLFIGGRGKGKGKGTKLDWWGQGLDLCHPRRSVVKVKAPFVFNDAPL